LRLRFIYCRRGPSLLVAEGRLNTKGRAVTSRSKTGRGVVTAQIFLLVPQVKLPKPLKRFAFFVNRGFTGLVCRDSLSVGGGSWANPTRWIFGSVLWLMLRQVIRRGRRAGCLG
jgi:hypothetical protein